MMSTQMQAHPAATAAPELWPPVPCVQTERYFSLVHLESRFASVLLKRITVGLGGIQQALLYPALVVPYLC